MKKTISMLSLSAIPFLSRAQGVPAEGKGFMIGIKSSIPYRAVATFNLGAEVYLARHWTLELEAGLNPFSGKNDDGSYGRSLRHLCLHLELRYWFCETSNGHFPGVYAPYLLYSAADTRQLGTEDERHQGRSVGAGISYGCSWPLSRYWDLKAMVSVGYLCLESDRHSCTNCGHKQKGVKKHHFRFMQAAINLIYQS